MLGCWFQNCFKSINIILQEEDGISLHAVEKDYGMHYNTLFGDKMRIIGLWNKNETHYYNYKLMEQERNTLVEIIRIINNIAQLSRRAQQTRLWPKGLRFAIIPSELKGLTP
ncbi:hypothetical protein FF38_12208 [Lucilia cuprina]|uniref:Uncharacterized protein n=1 Tax=Lucilia cuprina TaxID=7375 RepID=A0A0L0BR57_LUCCU|nr:hypothetical protein FF38_12208 [Lucilia cuprina]